MARSPAKTIATPLTLFPTAVFEEVLVGFAMELMRDETDENCEASTEEAELTTDETDETCEA